MKSENESQPDFFLEKSRTDFLKKDPVLTHAIYEIFDTICGRIKAAIEKSTISKKPVVVLFGQEHYSFTCELISILGVSAGVHLGFRKFHYEVDQTRHDDISNLMQKIDKSIPNLKFLPKIDFQGSYLPNRVLHSFMNSLPLSLIPIDHGLNNNGECVAYKNKEITTQLSYCDSAGIKHRNGIMADQIRQCKTNSFVFSGASHLMGLDCDEKLSDSHEVVIIDASEKLSLQNQSDYIKRTLEYANSTGNLVEMLNDSFRNKNTLCVLSKENTDFIWDHFINRSKYSIRDASAIALSLSNNNNSDQYDFQSWNNNYTPYANTVQQTPVPNMANVPDLSNIRDTNVRDCNL